MTLKKLTDLGYETLSQPPYSPDFFPNNYHFLKYLDIFYVPPPIKQKNNSQNKGEVETAFKDFLALKLIIKT